MLHYIAAPDIHHRLYNAECSLQVLDFELLFCMLLDKATAYLCLQVKLYYKHPTTQR